MNIIEQEDLVKGLPDQVLIQQAQMPTGEIPQFLVVSELDRRQKMRKAFAERVPEETVTERVISQGIAAMNPNPDPLMATAMGAQPPSLPPQDPVMGQQTPPPVQMYDGGETRMSQVPQLTQAQLNAILAGGITEEEAELLASYGASFDDLTLGQRINNPLNIRAGDDDPFEGYAPALREGGYEGFESPDYGLRAADRILNTYGSKRGIDTLSGVLNRFAPETDNNPTQDYIDFVSGRSGISPDAQIDLTNPAIRALMLSPMAEFESQSIYSPEDIQTSIERANQLVNRANRSSQGVKTGAPRAGAEDIEFAEDFVSEPKIDLPSLEKQISGRTRIPVTSVEEMPAPFLSMSGSPNQPAPRQQLELDRSTEVASILDKFDPRFNTRSSLSTDFVVESEDMRRRQKLLDMAASNAIKEDAEKLDPEDQTKELVEMATAPSTKDRQQVQIDEILAEARKITPKERENFLLESGVGPAKDQTTSIMENMFGTYDPVIAARGRGEDVFMRNWEEDQMSERLGIDDSRYIPLIKDVASRAIPFTENFLPRRALLQLASGDIEDYINRGLGAFSSTVSDVAEKGRDISELARQTYYGADIKDSAGRFADLIQRSAGGYGSGLVAQAKAGEGEQRGETTTEQELLADEYKKAKADQEKRFAAYREADRQIAKDEVSAGDNALIADNQQDGNEEENTLRRSALLAGTGQESEKDNTDLIQSLFGRSYKPMDKGALALVSLGAGIAKGDVGAGLQGAVQTIGDEEDRRRKAVLSAAQAKYYDSALARSNQDNVFDMYRQARLTAKDMSGSEKAALLSKITGRDVGLKEVDSLEETLIQHLATLYAKQSLMPARALVAGAPRIDGEASQVMPIDLTDEELVMMKGKLG